MPSHSEISAILDANVLIDYVLTDEDVLREAASYWKELCVPDCILDEVKQLSNDRAIELGLTILPTPFSEIELIPGLSLQDACCLYYASKRNSVCISNDVSLRKACQKKGRDVVWGLEMIVFLAREKKITIERGKDIGLKIKNINPEISEGIFTDFLSKLKKI